MPKTVPSLELFLTLGIGYSVLFYAWTLFGQALATSGSATNPNPVVSDIHAFEASDLFRV
jgi:hypothetical protein